MTLYSFKSQYPAEIPFRIRLPDGSTRTDPDTFTASDIAAAGYIAVSDPPTPTSLQVLEWNSTDIEWVVRDKTPEELQAEIDAQWGFIRMERNSKLSASDWTQLPDSPFTTTQKQAWATYRQDLRDVTTQVDPFNITWPVEP
jgi:hypothetical protein